MRQELDGTIDILLVEDNPGDVELVREAFSDGTLRKRLHTAFDGIQAMRFLRREEEFSQERRPDLVILDLNLPRKSGREVLMDMKSDPELRFIPVIVLTSSESQEDVDQSYRLHANCYVAKPIDLEQFLSVIRSIEEFWLTVVKLPYRH